MSMSMNGIAIVIGLALAAEAARAATPADAALSAVQDDMARVGADLNTVTKDLSQITKDLNALQQIIDAPPLPPPVLSNESPDGTIVIPGLGVVTDAEGVPWTLAPSTLIQKGGVPAYQGWQSNQLVYHLHKVFIFGLNGVWYSWSGAAFVADQSPLPAPKRSFYVAPGGSDVASGTATAPFASLGRCQAAMVQSPDIKNCNVAATPPGAYYDLHACSIDLTEADNGEIWNGDPLAVLDGGGQSQMPFQWAHLGPAHVKVLGFKFQNFTGAGFARP